MCPAQDGKMVNGLLELTVVRPSKSPYASPAFLVPNRDGGFRMVVDNCKVNAKVVLDSYPKPTIEQALVKFGGAVMFSILDPNSDYYQIPYLREVDGSLFSVPHSDYLNLTSCPWALV
jgi:hypothetical protein